MTRNLSIEGVGERPGLGYRRPAGEVLADVRGRPTLDGGAFEHQLGPLGAFGATGEHQMGRSRERTVAARSASTVAPAGATSATSFTGERWKSSARSR